MIAVCKSSIKGHFPSLLISNIFSNPHFLLSALRTFLSTYKTLVSKHFSFRRILLFFVPSFCKRRIFSDLTPWLQSRLESNLKSHTHIYIYALHRRVCFSFFLFLTPVRSISAMGLRSSFSVSLDCTSLSSLVLYHRRALFFN